MIKRSAGILMPIFSLPSPYGIGSIGREARAFADFLKESGQSWWQLLPLGPSGGGNSPYTTLSTFAGNPYFIDLDALAADGLLTAAELDAAKVKDSDAVDYAALYETRPALLRKAFSRITPETARAARDFRDQYPWVRDYTLYQAIKERFDGKAWFDWPEKALRNHEFQALDKWRHELEPEIAYHTWEQYCFFQQWEAFKKYVNDLGIKLIGDLPIYVSHDSSDVWAERTQFQLDAEGHPTKVAGVPPDYFSEDGQLWGNPLYNWETMKRDGFGWWIRRIEGASRLFDAIRIDHFRGLESYWAVPADAKTAKAGAWVKGPGMDLLRVLTGWFPNITYIAEDLGILTDAVHELRDGAGLPGMKVLQFAFSDASNAYLPHNYTNANCICYSGTHDNDTLMGWCKAVKKDEKAYAERYLGVKGAANLRQAVLRAGHGSVAVLFVAQMQDYLALGSDARTNVPGVADDNWRWRMLPGANDKKVSEEIRTLTETYGRCAPRPTEKELKAKAKADKKADKKAD